MNPIELMLQKLQAAQTAAEAKPSGLRRAGDRWIPKEEFVKEELPEQKFEHFDVHPAMKDFWKTKKTY
jgi:hypothetical protein